METATLWRVDLRTSNILATWKATGSPDYLRPDPVRELKATNLLQPSSEQVTI